jgi:plastocyanin
MLTGSALAPFAACGDDSGTSSVDHPDATAHDATGSDASGPDGFHDETGGSDVVNEPAQETGGDDASDGGAGDDADGSDASDAGCVSDGGIVNVQVGPNNTRTFSPSTVTICQGQTVKWTWMSSGHSVTSGTSCAADNAFCSPNDQNCSQGNTSNVNATYSHTFGAQGTFDYFCAPHCGSQMTGQVIVQ